MRKKKMLLILQLFRDTKNFPYAFKKISLTLLIEEQSKPYFSLKGKKLYYAAMQLII